MESIFDVEEQHEILGLEEVQWTIPEKIGYLLLILLTVIACLAIFEYVV